MRIAELTINKTARLLMPADNFALITTLQTLLDEEYKTISIEYLNADIQYKAE